MFSWPGSDCIQRRRNGMSINLWRSARISRICAGLPLPGARSAPGVAPQAPPGGPSADPRNPRGAPRVCVMPLSLLRCMPVPPSVPPAMEGYIRQGLAADGWAQPLDNRSLNAGSHAGCRSFVGERDQAFIWAREGHVAEAYGYRTCCA
ncbi:unnamed protein product [Prorocentrum cordatum]|uniref:Uncharacterized protein n=1 Tax=Prorocentrum cordatum TaxID=2364126 RepID=A0ABN9TGM2_9DINO|nr:unnamed protein product [Polarella glacialis]